MPTAGGDLAQPRGRRIGDPCSGKLSRMSVMLNRLAAWFQARLDLMQAVRCGDKLEREVAASGKGHQHHQSDEGGEATSRHRSLQELRGRLLH